MREIMDVCHQFVMSWGMTIDSAKATADIKRLKWYYEQYRDGFFTLIDYDGGGRNYVGRFVTPVEPIDVGNNRWAVQQVTFEEVPGVNMLAFPSDWTNDAIWRNVLSDFGEMQPAVDNYAHWLLEQWTATGGYGEGLYGVGAYSGPVQGGWDLRSNVTSAWVQLAYIGYGVQVWCTRDTNRGIAAVTLDGVSLGNIDQYSAAGNIGLELLLTQQNVPLGLHILQLSVTGTKNSASSGYYCTFNSLKVMR